METFPGVQSLYYLLYDSTRLCLRKKKICAPSEHDKFSLQVVSRQCIFS